jgi:LAGLIDADG DNA endonuclease family
LGFYYPDAWLQRGKANWNARLGLKQGKVHLKFFFHVWAILSHYCSALPYLTSTQMRGKRFFGVVLFTRALPCFTVLYDMFYVAGTKVIPFDIFNLLTPVALAYWIMGDGAARNMGIVLCTDSYSIPDIVRLMNVLMIKFDLKCTIHYDTPDKPRIYISKGSMDKLRVLVLPHMHPSMLYKIGV